MAKPSPPPSGPFWRMDWFAGVVVVIVFLALHLATNWPETLERRFYDVASTTSARQPSDQVVVVAIDAASLAGLGPWPWPRDLHASLIDRLSAANAKVIVHTALFAGAQQATALDYLQQIKALLGSTADATQQQPLTTLITEAQTALDTDGRLADSFSKAGNVIIVSSDTPGQQALERLASAAAGVGHLSLRPDADGVVRHETLLRPGGDRGLASLALLAAARSLDLAAPDRPGKAGAPVQVGPLRIPTDAAGRVLPQFYPDRGGQAPFAVDSLADVLAGKIPPSKYANKIVVIGVTAAGVVQPVAVPGHPALSPAEAVAHMTSSILRQHVLVQPRWGGWVTLAAWLVAGAYLIAVLPRLRTGAAVVVTGLLLVVLLGAEFFLLSVMGLWFQLVLAATLLMVGHLVVAAKRVLQAPAVSPRADDIPVPAETNRMLGLALQGQGQLDLAFERFRQVPLGPAVLGDLYRLALDFQRKGQFSQAEAVHQHMAASGQASRDDQNLSAALNPVRAQLPTGALPTLGRYRVKKELGKGAMGAVYLGEDPKIGRIVAIKTLALGEEFDEAGLPDARERFFREAKTAGRLQHPHIVTIFDVGEEHDLAYIAMEFLKGQDLTAFCKAGHLLPVPTVLSIVARVAEALDYAHRQQVVHRDIKPANIMFDQPSDSVKVTDFGIARITDSSKTRTGLVLGTPSFMSPEQLAGNKVDGRSDLYSLGVMLFQLLTGVLPFRADSLAALMHKIVNEEAPDLRSIRADLPLTLASLVAVSLSKRPQDRYQDGGQLAKDLRALPSGANPIDLEL